MRIITDTANLKAFVAELESSPFAAIDTEFMRDQTYWPKLCLIQVAGPETSAIVDPLADGLQLEPLYQLLASEQVMKVFHAARQDIEIFHHQAGIIPAPLFDTQIAAMVCGFGEAASYETLVRRITRSEIDKSARFTDWSRRPLSKRQLEYALADVTHLREIYRTLSKELDKSGRAPWVEEEEAALKDPETYRLDPQEAWRRLKPRSTNKRFLTVLVAVAAWREREAQARDVPRNRILKDEALLEIAAHPPTTPDALGEIRAIPNGYAQSRHGKAIVSAVKQGLESNLPERLPAPQRPRLAEPSPPVLDLLRTLLRVKAHQYRVAPRLVADSEDLERLATGDDDGVPALHGWRAEVFGRDAIALREGRLAIALDRGEAIVIDVGAERPRTPARAVSSRTTGRG